MHSAGVSNGGVVAKPWSSSRREMACQSNLANRVFNEAAFGSAVMFLAVARATGLQEADGDESRALRLMNSCSIASGGPVVCFLVQQLLLPLNTPPVAAQFPAFAHYSMTGHGDSNRISRTSPGHCPGRAGRVDSGCQL